MVGLGLTLKWPSESQDSVLSISRWITVSVTFFGSVPDFLGRVVYLLNWLHGSPVNSASH